MKRVGVGEERRTAATPPVRRPVVPEGRLAEGNHASLNGLCELGEGGLKYIGHNGLAILRFNSRMEIQSCRQ